MTQSFHNFCVRVTCYYFTLHSITVMYTSPSKRRALHDPISHNPKRSKADSTSGDGEHTTMDKGTQTAAYTNQGVGGVNRGMSAANAISNQNYAWGLPKDMISQHGFEIDCEHITTPINISMKNDEMYVIPTTFLTHYVNPNTKNYESLTATAATHMYKMKHCSIEVLVTAATRENLLVQAGTNFKSRDFLNCPLNVGINTAKTFYKMPGVINPSFNIRIPSINTAEIENWRTCVQTDEHEFKYRTVNVEGSHTVSYTQNVDEYFTVNDWDGLDIAMIRSGTDPDFLYTPQRVIIPTYQQETTGSNEFTFLMSPPTTTTPNISHTYLIHSGQHIQEIALSPPSIRAEDNTYMNFNYTIRFKHNITFHCVPKNPTRPANTRIYSATYEGVSLPIIQNDQCQRNAIASPNFGWETTGIGGYYRTAPILLTATVCPSTPTVAKPMTTEELELIPPPTKKRKTNPKPKKINLDAEIVTPTVTNLIKL